MKESKIIEVFGVLGEFENVDNFLMIYFSVLGMQGKKLGFSVGIKDDGESIYFERYNSWLTKEEIEGNLVFGKVRAISKGDSLFRLVGEQIEELLLGKMPGAAIRIGSGDALDEQLIYFKLSTRLQTFLYYNSGDKGELELTDRGKLFIADSDLYQWDSLYGE